MERLGFRTVEPLAWQPEAPAGAPGVSDGGAAGVAAGAPAGAPGVSGGGAAVVAAGGGPEPRSAAGAGASGIGPPPSLRRPRPGGMYREGAVSGPGGGLSASGPSQRTTRARSTLSCRRR